MLRGTSITLAPPGLVYSGAATLAGQVYRYTSTGARVPWAGRPVQILRRNPTDQTPRLLGTVRTDVRGRYVARVRISGTTTFQARMVAAGWYAGASTPLVTARIRLRPTSLTGSVGATNASVIRAGTRMSTYGHLRVVYTTGHTGPFARQPVLIQIRARGYAAAAYNTVAYALTTSTGYYYANWTADFNADVRVVYLSSYSGIASAYRWLALVRIRS